jgi:hypothetical protein
MLVFDRHTSSYWFGTHSGWLEACFDLGTAVIAPNCGYYHQKQRSNLSYVVGLVADGGMADRI